MAVKDLQVKTSQYAHGACFYLALGIALKLHPEIMRAMLRRELPSTKISAIMLHHYGKGLGLFIKDC